jgi:hypothetical protein
MAEAQDTTRAGPDERLREAAELVDSVMAGLDVRQRRCDCCGLTKAENFVDHMAADALGGMSEKLRRWANTLALPPEARRAHIEAQSQQGKRRRQQGRPRPHINRHEDAAGALRLHMDEER